MRRSSALPSVWLLIAATGCSTSLTTLQTAQTLEPGQVQVSAAGSAQISSTVIGEIVDTSDALADRFGDAETAGEPISEAEQRQALETGIALVLFTPGVSTEIGGRIGIIDRFDAGLKYAGTLVKADAKYQLVGSGGDGLALAANAGYTYHLDIGSSVAGSVYPILDFLKLGDYSRHDLDAGLIVSGEWGEVFKAYGSLRYIASFVSLDADIERVETATGIPRTSLSNTLHYVAGGGGAMLGYKHVFVVAELTLAYVIAEPVILGEARDLSGVIVSPTLGLLAKF